MLCKRSPNYTGVSTRTQLKPHVGSTYQNLPKQLSPAKDRPTKRNNHQTKDQEPPAKAIKHDYGWLPLSAPPLKWTDSGRVGNLCNTCNMPHLPKPCRFADKKYAKLANHESNKTWKESAIGKAWATLGYYSAIEHPPSWHKEQVALGNVNPNPRGPSSKLSLNSLTRDD